MTLNKTLLQYFKDHKYIFQDTIEALDDVTGGYLYDDRLHSMYDVDDYFNGASLTDVIKNLDPDFNVNHSYFYFGEYGYLESTDKKDYSDYLNDDFINTLINRYDQFLKDGITLDEQVWLPVSVRDIFKKFGRV